MVNGEKSLYSLGLYSLVNAGWSPLLP
jgi:hypothetical protein